MLGMGERVGLILELLMVREQRVWRGRVGCCYGGHGLELGWGRHQERGDGEGWVRSSLGFVL